MKTCSKCKEPKEHKEFNKNRAQKDGLDNQCTLCSRKSKSKWKKENPEKNAAQQRNYYARNSDIVRSKKREFNRNNPGYYNAINAKSHAKRIKRIPSFLTDSDWIEIDWAYEIAASKTLETGVKHEVDHIIPLCGKFVSGLHVPGNLRIITKKANQSKGNRF